MHELYAHPQHPYTIGLLGAIPRRGVERLQEIPGLVPALSAPIAHCGFAPRCARADDLSRTQVPELREIGAPYIERETGGDRQLVFYIRRCPVPIEGDSLSKIAKREYGDANKWRTIYEANKDLVNNPDLIYPGQELKLPGA